MGDEPPRTHAAVVVHSQRARDQPGPRVRTRRAIIGGGGGGPGRISEPGLVAMNDQSEVGLGDGARAELARQLPSHVLRSREDQCARRSLQLRMQLVSKINKKWSETSSSSNRSLGQWKSGGGWWRWR